MESRTHKEFRVLGPPGTGKTTYTARSVEVAADKHGADSVILASFTRTAAAELAGRGLPIPKAAVGTLHAHAFRALAGTGLKLLTSKHLKEWNEAYPGWATAAAATDLEEPTTEAADDETAQETKRKTGAGGDIIAEIGLWRNQLKPLETYPPRWREAASRWAAWKREEGLMDFTDLLELALKDTETAPGDPKVGFLDEAQDSTPLQLALWRKWGQHMDTCVLVGDDDQCIYTWTGARPDGLTSPALPPEHVRVLSQSHRVPRRIHRAACTIIDRVSARAPKEYKPTDTEGDIRAAAGTYKDPIRIVGEIERQISAGKTCMILGSCSYILKPIIKALRDEGIPYYNPYRRHQGEWNPLRAGAGKQTTVADRVRAWIKTSPEFDARGQEGQWTWQDVVDWSDLLDTKAVFTHGAKTAFKQKDPNARVEPWDLAEYVDQKKLASIYSHDFFWFRQNFSSKTPISAISLFNVLAKYGMRSIIEPPKGTVPENGIPWVTIGTIHSVKGGEADHVWIFPDISLAAWQGWESNDILAKDSIRRLFYVALTRARVCVHIPEPGTKSFYPLWRACQ